MRPSPPYVYNKISKYTYKCVPSSSPSCTRSICHTRYAAQSAIYRIYITHGVCDLVPYISVIR